MDQEPTLGTNGTMGCGEMVQLERETTSPCWPAGYRQQTTLNPRVQLKLIEYWPPDRVQYQP